MFSNACRDSELSREIAKTILTVLKHGFEVSLPLFNTQVILPLTVLQLEDLWRKTNIEDDIFSLHNFQLVSSISFLEKFKQISLNDTHNKFTLFQSRIFS